MAKTPCRVIALDDKQFHAGLQKKPDFALMLMSIMIGRTAFLMLVKTHPDFAESLLASLAERLRLLTAKLN